MVLQQLSSSILVALTISFRLTSENVNVFGVVPMRDDSGLVVEKMYVKGPIPSQIYRQARPSDHLTIELVQMDRRWCVHTLVRSIIRFS